MEKWKDIKGYEGLYQVSDFGNVRMNKRTRIRNEKGQCIGWSEPSLNEYILMKQSKDNKGYLRLSLTNKNHIRKTYKVHRLVIETFTERIGETCDHIDNIKDNNKLENLQWLNNGDNYRKNNSGDNHWTRRFGLSDEHKSKFKRYGFHSQITKDKISLTKKNNNNAPI